MSHIIIGSAHHRLNKNCQQPERAKSYLMSVHLFILFRSGFLCRLCSNLYVYKYKDGGV